jgi:hypothetical protein
MKKILILLLSFITIKSFAQLPSNIPSNGLLGYWPFTGNANDLSQNNNNGTVIGANLATDRFGNLNCAYNFDGVSNYIELPLMTSMNNQSQLSVSFWVKSNFLFDEQYKTVISHWLSTSVGSGPIGLQISLANINSSNQGGLAASLVASLGSWSNNNLIDSNSWCHIVFIFDGTRVNSTERFSLFVNGSFQGYFGDATIPNTTGNSANKTIFGAGVGPNNPNGVYNYYSGLLDDIGIWNRALTQQEISGVYNSNVCFQFITVTDTLLINTGITTYTPLTYQNTIKIYPNPTNDHITIDYGNYSTLNGYQLKIINAQGQQVFQTNITQQSSYVSLGSWTGSGLYFVHIIDGQGNTTDIRKIILQ